MRCHERGLATPYLTQGAWTYCRLLRRPDTPLFSGVSRTLRHVISSTQKRSPPGLRQRREELRDVLEVLQPRRLVQLGLAIGRQLREPAVDVAARAHLGKRGE